MRRRLAPALLAGALLWLLLTLHGAWSFGIVHGYLDGGRQPMNPSLPVTYGFFGLLALPVSVVVALLIVPTRFLRPAVGRLVGIALWLAGAWIGAAAIAFSFQIDFGTTWRQHEAVLGLFVHPVVTPACLVLGLAGLWLILRKGSTHDAA